MASVIVVLLGPAAQAQGAQQLQEPGNEQYGEMVQIYKAKSFPSLSAAEEQELHECLHTYGMTFISLSDSGSLTATNKRQCFMQDPYTIYYSPDAARYFEQFRKSESSDDVIVNEVAPEIGYVWIKSFHKLTLVDGLFPHLVRFAEEGRTKTIIDVQDNFGGGLITALRTAQLFSPDIGAFMIDTVPNDERQAPTRYSAQRPGAFRAEDTVILMNRRSVSAAEVFTRIVRHWGACVIGLPSFGKGSVQQLFPLKNGGIFQTTVSRFYADYDGGFFEGKSIEPDIYEDRATIDTAVDYLTGKRPCKETVQALRPTEE